MLLLPHTVKPLGVTPAEPGVYLNELSMTGLALPPLSPTRTPVFSCSTRTISARRFKTTPISPSRYSASSPDGLRQSDQRYRKLMEEARRLGLETR